MIDVLKKWESKGFRFCITPQQDKGKWLWTAGVYIGMERKADPTQETIDKLNNM